METSKKDLRFFVILTYVFFYIALGLCLAVVVLGVPMESMSAFAPIVISWVSFAVVMIWAKKLLNGTTRRDYMKDLFRDMLSLKWVVVSIALPTVLWAAVVLILSIILHKPLGELIDHNVASYPLTFLLNLIAGPLGEEFGWRGFFFIKENEKNGILKASVITGLVWGLWHAPLWLMEGFAPVQLIIYAVSFMGAFIGFNLIIGCIFGKHRNLIYSIIIHQLFNFLTNLLILDLNSLVWTMVVIAVLYLLAAGIMIIMNKKELVRVGKAKNN